MGLLAASPVRTAVFTEDPDIRVWLGRAAARLSSKKFPVETVGDSRQDRNDCIFLETVGLGLDSRNWNNSPYVIAIWE